MEAFQLEDTLKTFFKLSSTVDEQELRLWTNKVVVLSKIYISVFEILTLRITFLYFIS